MTWCIHRPEKFKYAQTDVYFTVSDFGKSIVTHLSEKA